MPDELDRAVALLGRLEGRIMRAVWTGRVAETFVVRDVQTLLPELAYTTVMTTVRRLADKGLLVARCEAGRRAHEYRASGGPGEFLAEAGARAAAEVVDRYGDAALAAFASSLAGLSAEQRRRLDRIR